MVGVRSSNVLRARVKGMTSKRTCNDKEHNLQRNILRKGRSAVEALIMILCDCFSFA